MSDLKSREERKRDAAWPPAARWQALQEPLTWAEAQVRPPRNSREGCLAEQRRKTAGPRP